MFVANSQGFALAVCTADTVCLTVVRLQRLSLLLITSMVWTVRRTVQSACRCQSVLTRLALDIETEF